MANHRRSLSAKMQEKQAWCPIQRRKFSNEARQDPVHSCLDIQGRHPTRLVRHGFQIHPVMLILGRTVGRDLMFDLIALEQNHATALRKDDLSPFCSGEHEGATIDRQ